MPGSGTRAGRSKNASPAAENSRLEIRRDPRKGRGVFAGVPISRGSIIEAAPVVIVPHGQRRLIDRTIVHDYYFQWGDGGEGEGPGVVALGLVSLCNHSRRPNARVWRNEAEDTLDLVATRAIAAGEEITIDYKCTLWFKPEE